LCINTENDVRHVVTVTMLVTMIYLQKQINVRIYKIYNSEIFQTSKRSLHS